MGKRNAYIKKIKIKNKKNSENIKNAFDFSQPTAKFFSHVMYVLIWKKNWRLTYKTTITNVSRPKKIFKGRAQQLSFHGEGKIP